MIKEINGRYTCTICGYEWSACMEDHKVPLECECTASKGMLKMTVIIIGKTQDDLRIAINDVAEHIEYANDLNNLDHEAMDCHSGAGTSVTIEACE